MNTDDFFNLSESERQYLIDQHNKRKKVKATRDYIKEERKTLDVREANNQMYCDHPAKKERYVAHENEYGNLTGGGTTHYYCEDCGFRWSDEK